MDVWGEGTVVFPVVVSALQLFERDSFAAMLNARERLDNLGLRARVPLNCSSPYVLA